MEWVINPKEYDLRIPIKSWCEAVEAGAMKQAFNLAKLPYAFHHISLMPDTHLGYGMPIGGVMATKDVIVPNAVGYDINCGMRAIRTDFFADSMILTPEIIKIILGKIREVIPVGDKSHKEKQESTLFDNAPDIPIIQQQLQRVKYQIGTLGSGNHFIELQKDSALGNLWIMLHSGSRNFGYRIAKQYYNKAKVLSERYFSDLPDQELSFLSMQEKVGNEYFEAMNYAGEFAKLNRKSMMLKIIDIVKEVLNAKILEEIDVRHNYARIENHYGKDVFVHRKGAINARKNVVGIIPGSQGTNSYITKGLGNADSFESSSHGAGRILGRNQARKVLKLKEQIKKLNDKGVIHSIRNQEDLDEAPGAYKNIEDVMKSQEDLCKIIFTLKPLGVVKA